MVEMFSGSALFFSLMAVWSHAHAEQCLSWTVNDGVVDNKCPQDVPYATLTGLGTMARCARSCMTSYPECLSATWERSRDVCQHYNGTHDPANLVDCTKTYIVVDTQGQRSNSTTALCSPGWSAHGSACYRYNPESVSFNQALALCGIEGAQLASVHNDIENSFIASLLPSGSKAFIGMLKQTGRRVQTTFLWTDQSAADYFHWALREPDGLPTYENNNCISLKQGSAQWYDGDCYASLPYLCKKE